MLDLAAETSKHVEESAKRA